MTNKSDLSARPRAGGAAVDVAIIGAGFAGMYMLHRVRQLGMSVRVFERESDVGGTWYANRYPGCRCDVESLQYSYSFSDEIEQEWTWSERFSPQPEILAYANFVADKLDLRRDITFSTEIKSATFIESENVWRIETGAGETISARFCVTAVGCLSAARVPDIQGIADFEGPLVHTGRWPREGVKLAGKRVGVIGTGSSGVQAIPVIAEQAGELFVFQRTPQFSLPARNRPLGKEEVEAVKKDYKSLRATALRQSSGTIHNARNVGALAVSPEEREREYWERWEKGGISLILAFNDIITDIKANETAAAFVRQRMSERIKDPQVAERLIPTKYPIGAKRICLDTNYFETFNKPNVHLVDIRETPIEKITATGIVAGDKNYELEVIVFATGFDAITGPLLGIDFRGENGLSLREKWRAGPRTYLGVMTAGFPNLFTITGPGSPCVLSNMIVSIEQHVEWIADCLKHLRAAGATRMEAKEDAENAWVDHVNDMANQTLMVRGDSWYLGANIPGKPRVFMPYVGGVPTYRAKCDEVAAKNYEGFEIA